MAASGLAVRSERGAERPPRAHRKPVHKTPQPPAQPIRVRDEMERRSILKRLKKTENMEDVLSKFAKEVKARFPLSGELELRLDNSMPNGLCVDVSVNQGYDPIKDEGFESWFIKESRKVHGLLIYTLQYA